MQNTDICIRLKTFISFLKLNKSDFSKKLGYKSQEKISRLFRDTNTFPSYHTIYDIATCFESLNIDWLITGRGEMLNNASETQTVKEPQEYYQLRKERIKPTISSTEPTAREYQLMADFIEELKKTTSEQRTYGASLIEFIQFLKKS